MIHGVTEAWGYTVTCREKTAGFTGDTSFCPGMEEIVRGEISGEENHPDTYGQGSPESL